MRSPVDIDAPSGKGDAQDDGAILAPAPILDVAYLDIQVAGERELRQELLRLYVGRLIALAPSVCGPPSPQRRDAAHALKGASLAIGAAALARICGGIERDDEAARREAALTVEMTRRRVEALLHQDG